MQVQAQSLALSEIDMLEPIPNSTCYERHELSAIWPDMNGEDLQELTDSIESEGQRMAIQVYEGKILDGWHRYLACKRLNFPIMVEDFSGTPDQARDFVIGINARRRHLTKTQKALCVVQVHKWYPLGTTAATSRCADIAHLEGPKLETMKTAAELAEIAGVGVRTIVAAKQFERAGLGERVRRGDLSASAASKRIRKPAQRLKRTPAGQQAMNVKVPESSEEPPSLTMRDQLVDAERLASEMLAENQGLKDRLAALHLTATPEEKTAAEERIQDLRQQIASLEVKLDVIRSSRDSAVAENNELRKAVKSLQYRNKRLATELKAVVRDPGAPDMSSHTRTRSVGYRPQPDVGSRGDHV
jgi:hypothetical protein